MGFTEKDTLPMINQTFNDATVLTHAFLKHDVNLVRLLLSKGARLGTSCHDKKLIITMTMTERSDLIKLAVQAGANVNIGTMPGNKWNALFFAISRKDLPTAKVLIEAKIDIRKIDDDGDNVLHMAVIKQLSYEWFELFLLAGADPEVLNLKDGISPFFKLCRDHKNAETRCRVAQLMLKVLEEREKAKTVESNIDLQSDGRLDEHMTSFCERFDACVRSLERPNRRFNYQN